MTAVMAPLQGLSLDREIMDPSPMSPNASRHGRSKHGGSVAKIGKRIRGHSVVDERETLVSKALTWVLKRTAKEGEKQDEGLERLVADSDGWVACEEVLQHPNVSPLEPTFPEIQTLIASPTTKSRFSLKLKPSTKEGETPSATNWLIRLNPTINTPATPTITTPKLTPLTTTTEDLPPLIVYETSYPNYPLILSNGGIRRAGGQAHLSFSSIQISPDGTEIRHSNSNSDADVSIYINLREVMEKNPALKWARNERGDVITAGNEDGELLQEFWKKAVARRADIGVLFEDGEVKKEVPIGLRGKGAKVKKGGTGKGAVKKEMKARSEDEGTASD